VLGCYCRKLGEVLFLLDDPRAGDIAVRASRIFHACGYGDDLGRTSLLLARFVATFRHSQVEQVRKLGIRGMALQILHFGKDDPALSSSLTLISALKKKYGDLPGAELIATTALALAEQLGEYHPGVGLPLLHWCRVVSPKEEEPASRALLILESKYGHRNHVDLARAYEAVAVAVWGNGNAQEASEMQSRAVTMYEACLGKEHRVTHCAREQSLMYLTGAELYREYGMMPSVELSSIAQMVRNGT